MAEQKVSYRYAKALLDTAVQHNLTEQIFEDFKSVSKIFSALPELLSLARKPIIAPQRKKKLYQEIFSFRISELTMNFILFLVDKNRDDLILDIIKQYENLYYKLNDYLPVEIYVAVDVGENTKKKIVEKIAKNTGKKIVPKFIVNPRIKGGFIVKVEDWVYDASLKNKLDSLYEKLVSNESNN